MAMSWPILMNRGPRPSMVSLVHAASFLVRALFLQAQQEWLIPQLHGRWS